MYREGNELFLLRVCRGVMVTHVHPNQPWHGTRFARRCTSALERMPDGTPT